jgi:hypothetical protein
MAAKNREYVVVRTLNAGVHAGELVEHEPRDKVAILSNVRRIWYWRGANTLNEIANHGVGAGSKVSEPAKLNTLSDVIEVISATDKARKNLEAAKWGE